ncbi:FAD/NAD(P)-binding protein [Stigmatella sp. ncwal1]|uniref:FAD/NAD(P)-binding protein n=1 Tax=Stigmatella ashevillensis TaxID=2995309 RepID=A0ABT5DBR4_9BACT|nr:FAD/NAD(P)-binding domain-containing protein [Stigmatella ashevillena]MDC0711115.1 FAD/NAD(P)-binding protein [Stigmatella ashevillena]
MSAHNSDAKNITVVGGGASAVSLLANLADLTSGQAESCQRSPLGKAGGYTVRIIEMAHCVGPGRAYRHRSDELSLNTDADTMGIRSKQEFSNWLREKNIAQGSIPRSLFAQYLRQKLEHAIAQLALSGVHVELVRAEVRDIERHLAGYAIRTDRQEIFQSDLLVLASGGSYGTPYESLSHPQEQCLTLDNLEDAAPLLQNEAEIVVLGTSQSAIDAALFLSRTTSARITLASRWGGLPLTKGKPKAYINQRLNATHCPLTLQEFMRLLEEELQCAEAYPSQPHHIPRGASLLTSISSRSFNESIQEARIFRLGWQAVMNNLTPQLQAIYERFTPEEKLQFADTCLPSLRRLRGAIPLQNAERLFRLLDHQRVRVLPGVRDVRYSARTGYYSLVFDASMLESKFIVNTTGLVYKAQAHPLLKRLPFIRTNLLGGVSVDVHTMRVIDGLGKPDPTCYCLGANTYGDFIITNSMEICARQARSAAASILQMFLTDPLSPSPRAAS